MPAPAAIFAMKYPDSEGSIWLRVQRAYDQCGRLLREAGCEGYITYPKRTGQPAYAIEHLTPIELNLQDYSPTHAAKIASFCKERNIKAVVFRDVPPSEVDLKLFHRLGVRTIDYVIGGFRPDFKLSWPRRIVNRIRAAIGWRHHDIYVPNSMDGYEVLTERLFYPRDRVVTVRNGVDIDRFAPPEGPGAGPGAGPRPDPATWGLPRTDHYVLMICQARAEKRIDYMIQAAAEVFKRRSDLSVTFVHVGGGGLLETWKEQARKLNLANRFHFLGRQDDPAPFYRLADIMLHVSEFEAFGNVCLEAMSTGLPVICSDIGGPRELIVHGETGYLLPIDDVQGFADHIIELLDDPSRRCAMGDAGRRRAVELYSMEREVREFFTVLRGQMERAS